MTTESRSASLVRDAFRLRAAHAVEQIARTASLEALTEALASATDFGAVASALGHGGIPDSARDLDPLADAVARGAGARENLAARAGGLLPASDIGRAIGISRQAVDKRRRALQLLAVRLADDWRYPAAQIDGYGDTPELLPTVLSDGAALGLTGWAMLDFLLAPDAALDGQAPLERLRGPAAADVLRLLAAARADAFG